MIGFEIDLNSIGIQGSVVQNSGSQFYLARLSDKSTVNGHSWTTGLLEINMTLKVYIIILGES